MISMSFQLIGFLLTYLLHTSHAAKNGSRAGLGITLIQFGFTMRSIPINNNDDNNNNNIILSSPGLDDGNRIIPTDPNDHNFDPSKLTDIPMPNYNSDGMSLTGDWISYLLMIAGWFILIKATIDFIRACKKEQLIRNSPDRGLPVPVIGTGEGERAV